MYNVNVNKLLCNTDFLLIQYNLDALFQELVGNHANRWKCQLNFLIDDSRLLACLLAT